MWRQGDIFIAPIEAIPAGMRSLKRPVLASSDSSGHKHQIKDRRTATLYARFEGASQAYLEVTADEARLCDDPVVQAGANLALDEPARL